MKPALLFVLLLSIAPLTAHAQFDVNASVYGQYSGTTTGNGISQSPSNSAGVLLGVRRYERPWRGYEVTYAYNQANYDFSGTTLNSVAARAQSVTADYVVSVPFPLVGLRPFALGGAGAVFFAPQNNNGITSSETKALFSYGAGIDIRLIPHIGLRLQYRGLVYRAPDFGEAFLSTNSFTRTAEPVAGLYFKL